MPKKSLVVLTGAGMSAESGLKTFRDSGGLWEGHDVMKVASPEGWAEDPELVLDFYNQRRRQLGEVEPNAAHKFLASLEDRFEVDIITQNVDDLHERAGSTRILHLHGELRKVESSGNPNYLVDIGYTDLKWGETCPDGHQMRPHVVWFGEPVPAMEDAIYIAANADVFAVIGTSLQVYPAAGLLHYTRRNIPKTLVDPFAETLVTDKLVYPIGKTAVEGIDAFNEFLQAVE